MTMASNTSDETLLQSPQPAPTGSGQVTDAAVKSMGSSLFSLKRKGDYRLRLTRTLKQPGRYLLDFYIFTPHESSLSTWTLAEQHFFFQSIKHRFSLLGLPDQDRVGKADRSFALLSPYYEIMYGSSLFQYRASMDRLRQQLQSGEFSAEPIKRALRLSQNFGQRLRNSIPGQSNQQRYFRLADIYFSWRAEQFMLECMTLEGFAELDQELKDAIVEFLQQEYRRRRERDYLGDFHGTPTRIWNRMSLYNRLLEYPVMLRTQVAELGAGTRKLVKMGSTTVIMSLFTYFLFYARAGLQELSLTLLLGIALVYALRDVLRDDMISGITQWLRKGKPRWKISLLTPYTDNVLATQRVWLEYRKQSELPQQILDRSSNWANNEDRQVICYRSELLLSEDALEQDQIQERLSLDCEELCEMIQAARNQLFSWTDPDDFEAGVQAQPIEKQHDYNLLLVLQDPDQRHTSAQRWHLRLSKAGVVHCDSKQQNWPRPEEQQPDTWLQGLSLRWRRR